MRCFAPRIILYAKPLLDKMSPPAHCSRQSCIVFINTIPHTTASEKGRTDGDSYPLSGIQGDLTLISHVSRPVQNKLGCCCVCSDTFPSASINLFVGLSNSSSSVRSDHMEQPSVSMCISESWLSMTPSSINRFSFFRPILI